MKEIKIIEVPMSEQDKTLLKFYKDVKKMDYPRYYIGFESNPSYQYSTLFENLSWLRKHFGVDKNESSVITKDSLNEARKNELSNYQKCLDYNCPLYELSFFNDDGTVKQYKNNKGEMVDYRPVELSESGRKQFQNYINNGLLVLCKLV